MASFVFRLLVSGPDPIKDFEIPQGVSTLGRQSGCELLLPHKQVSRQHAQLYCSREGCQIVDLGSSNGTWVDGEKLIPQVPIPLTEQAVIKIGPFELVFQQTAVKPKPDTSPTQEDREKRPQSVTPTGGDPPERRKKAAGAAVPPPQPTAPSPVAESDPGLGELVPPGLSIYGDRLIQFLPDIYHTDFMLRYMGIFESILTPIEWNLDNFDLFLDPGTAPEGFLGWLASWYQITFNPTWDEAMRRTLLQEAHQIYARRGTPKALCRVLEIFTGVSPEIEDLDDDLAPFTFRVKLALNKNDPRKELIEALIDAHKPAYTTHLLVLS